jgi:hypothetical protein
METYEVRVYSELAFRYKDPSAWFHIGDIFVPNKMPSYKGKYFVDGALDWYRRHSGELSKEGYPQEIAGTTAEVSWETTPRGLSFPLQIRDLKDYISFGYQSEAQMQQRKVEYLTHHVKLNRECAGITFIETDANYDADQIYTIGVTGGISTAGWNNKTTSNPISDVMVIKRANKRINTMAMNYTVLTYLMEHPDILDAATVNGAARDASLKPEVQVAFLENVFGLKVLVFMADAVSNSTLAVASQTKTSIWGNYVWFGYVDGQAVEGNPDRLTWGKEYIYAPEGEGVEGFIYKETIDQRAGIHGKIHMDLGYDNQFATYAKSYGAKLKSVY